MEESFQRTTATIWLSIDVGEDGRSSEREEVKKRRVKMEMEMKMKG